MAKFDIQAELDKQRESNGEDSSLKKEESQEQSQETQEQQIESREQQTETKSEEQKQEEIKRALEISFDKIGKEYASEDDFYNDWQAKSERAKKADELEAEYQKVLAEREKLNQEVSKLRPTSNMDETLLRLQTLKSQSEDSYNKMATMLYGGVSDIDYLKMQYKEEFPDKDDALIEKLIKREYNLNVDLEDLDEDEREDYEIRKMKMERDARKYKESKLQEFNSIEIPTAQPKPSEEQIALHKAELEEKWRPHSGKIVQAVGDSIKANITNEDLGLNFDYKYELTPKMIKEYEDIMVNHIKEGGVDFTKESLNSTMILLKDAIIRDNFGSIIQNAVEKAVEANNKEWSKKINNPSGYKQQQTSSKNDNEERDKKINRLTEGRMIKRIR